MTDTTYPDFEQYQPATAAYLRTLLAPYHEALTAADSIETLTQWVPLVLPENADELNAAIAELDVSQAKIVILLTLASILVLPHNNLATPWDLVKDRSELATRLFGPSSTTVPVLVTVGPNSFTHDLTEEQTYGILFGIENSPEFLISTSGVKITPADYQHLFINPDIGHPFVAVINDEEIFFSTTDFVQGIITAAQWTNRDPHSIITSLSQIGEDGSNTPLNF